MLVQYIVTRHHHIGIPGGEDVKSMTDETPIHAIASFSAATRGIATGIRLNPSTSSQQAHELLQKTNQSMPMQGRGHSQSGNPGPSSRPFNRETILHDSVCPSSDQDKKLRAADRLGVRQEPVPLLDPGQSRLGLVTGLQWSCTFIPVIRGIIHVAHC
jgi:hypothetical protein